MEKKYLYRMRSGFMGTSSEKLTKQEVEESEALFLGVFYTTEEQEQVINTFIATHPSIPVVNKVDYTK